jgi:hypothetical protein
LGGLAGMTAMGMEAAKGRPDWVKGRQAAET